MPEDETDDQIELEAAEEGVAVAQNVFQRILKKADPEGAEKNRGKLIELSEPEADSD